MKKGIEFGEIFLSEKLPRKGSIVTSTFYENMATHSWICDFLCSFSLADTTDIISISFDGHERSRHRFEIYIFSIIVDTSICPFIPSEDTIYRFTIKFMREIHNGKVFFIEGKHFFFFIREWTRFISKFTIVCEMFFGFCRDKSHNLECSRINRSTASSFFSMGDNELKTFEYARVELFSRLIDSSRRLGYIDRSCHERETTRLRESMCLGISRGCERLWAWLTDRESIECSTISLNNTECIKHFGRITIDRKFTLCFWYIER